MGERADFSKKNLRDTTFNKDSTFKRSGQQLISLLIQIVICFIFYAHS
jgi:hypothetical protein